MSRPLDRPVVCHWRHYVGLTVFSWTLLPVHRVITSWLPVSDVATYLSGRHLPPVPSLHLSASHSHPIMVIIKIPGSCLDSLSGPSCPRSTSRLNCWSQSCVSPLRPKKTIKTLKCSATGIYTDLGKLNSPSELSEFFFILAFFLMQHWALRAAPDSELKNNNVSSFQSPLKWGLHAWWCL